MKAHLRIARDAVGLHSVARVSVLIERPGNLETCSGSAIHCIAGCYYSWGAEGYTEGSLLCQGSN